VNTYTSDDDSDYIDNESTEHSKNSSEELEDTASDSESTEHSSKETSNTSKEPSKKSKRPPVSNCRIFFWFGKISSIPTINITNHNSINFFTLRSNKLSQPHLQRQ
jgi:hypothetical protein